MSEEELETLEDLELGWYWINEREHIIKELREEAKKWIKYLLMHNPVEYAYTYIPDESAKIRWIMHFFNITEEELLL